jgi:hypothetical protein
MDKKELCKRYIEVINSTRDKDEALEKAFQAINPDNYVMGLVPDEVTNLLNDMFATIVGQEVYDWITWWLYETDQKSSKIWTNGEEVDINSFDDLWAKVLKDE